MLVSNACVQVPGTGRSQLNLVSDAQIRSLGDQTYRELLSDQSVIRVGSDVERLQKMPQRIIRSAEVLYPQTTADLTWEIVLIDDPTPNAFALPGGQIGMHTGMVELAESDDAIAIVIGHEVAHVIAAHAAERFSQQVLIGASLALGSEALGDQDEDTRAVIMGVLGVGGTLGVALPYSRLHESEADELGLMIAANAGYDPRAAIPLWRRMEESSSGQLEFLSTHPVPETRINDFRRIMPQAMRLYRRAKRS